jgi:hypothetical protein
LGVKGLIFKLQGRFCDLIWARFGRVKVQGLGFTVKRLGYKGLGFEVQCSELRI